MSWIQRQSSSHSVQLAATAILSGAAVAGVILGYQSVRRKAAIRKLKSSIPSLEEEDVQKVSVAGSFAACWLCLASTMLTDQGK
jgi:hypothetical protein